MQKLWRTLRNSYLPVLFFLTIGSQAQAQVFRDIHNAQSIDWINAAKYMGLPYGTTPDLNSSRLSPGAVFYNTTDSTLYNWTGTQWVKAGGSKTVLLGYLLNKDTLGGFERINVDSLKLDSLLNALAGPTDTSLIRQIVSDSSKLFGVYQQDDTARQDRYFYVKDHYLDFLAGDPDYSGEYTEFSQWKKAIDMWAYNPTTNRGATVSVAPNESVLGAANGSDVTALRIRPLSVIIERTTGIEKEIVTSVQVNGTEHLADITGKIDLGTISGSSGVTSITAGYGTTGGTITTTGTIAADTTVLESQARAVNRAVLKLNISDTLQALKSYSQIPSAITVGNIFIDSFNRTSLGSNYSTSIPNTTIQMGANHLTLVNGNQDSLNYLRYNWATCSESYTVVLKYVNKKLSTTSKGLSVGLFSTNANGFVHHNRMGIYQNTGNANFGKVYFSNPSTAGAYYIGTGAISSISVGDTIQFTYTRDKYTITYSAINLANGQTSSGTSTFSPTSPFIFSPNNTANPAIWNNNGSGDSLIVTSFSYTLNDLKYPEIMNASNSIGLGQGSTALPYRYASLFYNNTYQVVNSSGGADVSADIISRLPEIKLINPKYFVLMDGGNDVLFVTPISTTMGNLQRIKDSLTSWGTKVIVAANSPRNSINLKPLRDSIYNRFISQNAIVITSTFDSLATGTALISGYNSGDGVHPSNAGHARIAAMIKAAIPVVGLNQIAYVGNPVIAVGQNYVSKFNIDGSQSNSKIYDDGTNIGVGLTTPTYPLTVLGSIGTKVNASGTAANPTYSTIAAYQAASFTSDYPTTNILTGASISDVNTIVQFAPLFSGPALQLPTTMVVSTNKDGSNASSYQITMSQSATASKIYSTKAGAATTAAFPIDISAGLTNTNARFLTNGRSLFGTLTDNGSDMLQVNGNLSLNTAGNKIKIATGTNSSVGTATLVAGTVTVSTTAALTASKIFVTVVTPGGVQGFLSVPTITNATSFVINSTSAAETSTVNWWIIN